MAELYSTLHTFHYWLSRVGLVVGLVMLVVALYIGLARHGDVTKWFRRGAYAVTAFIGVEFVLGITMFLLGGRPGEDRHRGCGNARESRGPGRVSRSRLSRRRIPSQQACAESSLSDDETARLMPTTLNKNTVTRTMPL